MKNSPVLGQMEQRTAIAAPRSSRGSAKGRDHPFPAPRLEPRFDLPWEQTETASPGWGRAFLRRRADFPASLRSSEIRRNNKKAPTSGAHLEAPGGFEPPNGGFAGIYEFVRIGSDSSETVLPPSFSAFFPSPPFPFFSASVRPIVAPEVVPDPTAGNRGPWHKYGQKSGPRRSRLCGRGMPPLPGSAHH